MTTPLSLRVTQWLSIAILAVIGLWSICLIYWLVDPTQPIYNEGPAVKLLNNEGRETHQFRPGEMMYVERTYCRRGDAPGVTRRTFENSAVFVLPTTQQTFSQPGCFTKRFPVVVPALHPGEYIYRVSTIFDVNPIRSIAYNWQPVTVEILGKE